MKKKNEPLEVHLIRWRDAASATNWESLETARQSQLSVITTVGFLLADETDRLVVTGSTSSYGALASLAIPRESIIDHEVYTL